MLKPKLAWILQTRRRITVFVLATMIVVASVSYGVTVLKNNYRAFDGDTAEDLPGYDYVENVSIDMFEQGFAAIPSDQLSALEKSYITTELAGADYFRLATAAERQEFLQSWAPAVSSWKQFVEQADTPTWEWLGWLQDYCDDGEKTGTLPPSFVGKAQAQLSTCVKFALTEAKTPNLVAARKEFELTLTDFEVNWSGFFNIARERCIARGQEPFNVCAAHAKFLKVNWSDDRLDLLYERYWPDLASRRNSRFFNYEEVQRIKTVVKYFTLKDEKELKEAWIELGKLELEMILWATPGGVVSKGIMTPFRISGRAVTALAGSRTAAPWVYGAAIQTARLSDKFINAATTGLSKINITKMFAKSHIPTVPIKKAANSTINVSPYYYQNAIGLKISETLGKFLEDQAVYNAVKASGRVANLTEYKALIDKLLARSYVVSPKQIAYEAKAVAQESCPPYGLARSKTSETFYNETVWTNQIKGGALTVHEPKLVMHETGHQLSAWQARPAIKNKYVFETSTCKSWNIFEESAANTSTELLAERATWYRGNKGTLDTYGAVGSIERASMGWQTATINALGRRYNLSVEQAENLWLKYYYGYGLDKLGKDLMSGLPSSIRTGHTSMLDFAMDYFERGDYQGAIDIINRLRWK